MKDLITIGLPSKGRLKEKSISFFNDRGLKIIQSEKERNYFGTIENKPNVKIIFLSFSLCKIFNPLLLKNDIDFSFNRPLLGKPMVIKSFIYFLNLLLHQRQEYSF